MDCNLALSFPVRLQKLEISVSRITVENTKHEMFSTGVSRRAAGPWIFLMRRIVVVIVVVVLVVVVAVVVVVAMVARPSQ